VGGVGGGDPSITLDVALAWFGNCETGVWLFWEMGVWWCEGLVEWGGGGGEEVRWEMLRRYLGGQLRVGRGVKFEVAVIAINSTLNSQRINGRREA